MIRRRSHMCSKPFDCDSEVGPERNIMRVRGNAINDGNRRRRGRSCHFLLSGYVLSQAIVSAYIFPTPSTNSISPINSKSAAITTSIFSPESTLRSCTSISSAVSDSSEASTTNASSSNQENKHDNVERPPPSSVEELLRIYGYSERIVKLDFDNSNGQLIGQRIVRNAGRDEEESFVLQSEDGVFAEVQDGGNSRVCRILGIKTPASGKSKKTNAGKGETIANSNNLMRPPLLEIAFLNDGEIGDESIDHKSKIKTIDVGQITTIWALSDSNDEKEAPLASSSSAEDICIKVEQILPVNHVENVMENRFKYHVARGRNTSGGGALTKKQVEMFSAAASVEASSSLTTFEQTEELRRVIDLILKQCVRCGSKFSRLLDSAALEDCMFYDKVEGTIMNDYTSGSDTTLYERRVFCATTLAKDIKIGGRFKRMSCMWLPPQISENDEETVPSSPSSATLTFVNGGWIVVDQSVRAANEGRRFAAAALASGGKFEFDSKNERILCRLESLALGEKLKQQKRGEGAGIRLEVDVRTVLEAMDLPLSSEGAREALFRIGRWTKNESGSYVEKGKLQYTYEPWSPSVLEAARWYVQMDRIRRREMKTKILELRETGGKKPKKSKKNLSQDVLEGRIDLTNLPCICIDGERTSFRDDAIGIRKRSSTGRKVRHKSSQWELLFHIADVSDIYAPDPAVLGSPCASGTAEGQPATSKTSLEEQKTHLKELGGAARSRIRSEYDLPLGPLHLLPTSVLRSLSLDVFKQDWTSDPSTWQSSWHTMDKDTGNVNRAVTLWVYIDERDGFLIDCGIERSIISRPLALTFKSATKLLDATERQQKNFPPMLAKARILLSVAERNIGIWNDRRQKRSDVARAREEKLLAREMVSSQVFGGRKKRRDDGRDGDFYRTRGHKLVDSTLYLYENALRMMIHRKKAMIPQHPYSATKGFEAGMRSATAPLRYYLQGIAQRQALAVMCDYSTPALSNEECKKLGVTITTAANAKQTTGSATNGPRKVAPRQLAAVRSLKSHLRKHSSSQNRVVPAISTGKNSEVVIQGVGAVAFCKEVSGTIKPGVKVMVRILNVDEKIGKVVVALDSMV